MKILAIQFRYLGDAALLTPALRAIKDRFSGCALHVLLAEEAVPVLRHLPWLDRVWAYPRRRGRAGLRQSWPLLRALRRERFDRSVDFVGNDRGALVSLACGAPCRLAHLALRGFMGRRLCYTQTVPLVPGLHQVLGNLRLLANWGIAAPDRPRIEIAADPARAEAARQLLPHPAILCHLGTSQPRKEWPVAHWAKFYRLAAGSGYGLVFSTGLSPREQALLEGFRRMAPEAPVLPPAADLDTFIAVIRRARLFISGDTGPLHFAAGLGVPAIALFGPSSAKRWEPFSHQYRTLQGGPCTCDNSRSDACYGPVHCMAGISPRAVLAQVAEMQPAAA